MNRKIKEKKDLSKIVWTTIGIIMGFIAGVAVGSELLAVLLGLLERLFS